MVTKLILIAAMAAGQFSELDYLFPDLLLTEANGPPSMCGLSAKTTQELAQAVRSAPSFSKANVESKRFEVYDTADHMQEFVLTLEGDPAHPAVACRELRHEDGELKLTRHMNCSGLRDACNRLFVEFRTLDSQLKGVPIDNQLSLPEPAQSPQPAQATQLAQPSGSE
jgi:hypothetical protein